MSLVKLFSLLPRRTDLTEAEFHRHWSTVHRDCALKIRALRRYVQLHRTHAALPGFAPTICDGIPEVWLDDVDTASRLRHDPDYLACAAVDEPNFIDMTRRAGMVTTENVRVSGPPMARSDRPTKGLLLVAREASAPREEFEEWWTESFASMVVGSVSGLTRFVQCLQVATVAADRPGSFDAVAELWWNDDGAMERASGSLQELARALAGSPVDIGRTRSLAGVEYRVIWPDNTDPSGIAELETFPVDRWIDGTGRTF